MIDERAYELLCCQLGLANEEKAGLRKQNKELIARLESIEKSNRENSKALIDTINDLKYSLEKQSTTVEHYRKEMDLMKRQMRYPISGFSLRTAGNTVSAVPPSKEGC